MSAKIDQWAAALLMERATEIDFTDVTETYGDIATQEELEQVYEACRAAQFTVRWDEAGEPAERSEHSLKYGQLIALIWAGDTPDAVRDAYVLYDDARARAELAATTP